ncbi:MAG: HlyD family efflux transporter periplasmic adaptor subunit [Deltaproteobacteria bacterium]|nr:HlyD family efflux transporter periplasmic adaptor subunit [Deltaproteobacteria bacterium]
MAESRDSLPLRVVGRLLGVAIVVGAVVLGGVVYRSLYRWPRTDDAYVRANYIGIAPHVSGPIVELPIVDNQFVRQGDLLFVVDPRPYQAVLDAATAKLALTDLEIGGYRQAVDAAEAALVARLAEAEYAAQYANRLVPLLNGQYVTSNQVVEAKSKAAASAAAVARARAEVARARELLGQLGDVNARRQAAQAAVDDARLNVDYCYVRAPFDAWITNLNIAVGEYANQGQEIFALIDDRQWFVMANFRESFLRRIAPGMTVDVYLISYPQRRFRGTVQGVGWGLFQQNGATVGVLPEVQPTLNWVRLAQRFPVRIQLDERDPAHPFRMGQTAVVTVRGDR